MAQIRRPLLLLLASACALSSGSGAQRQYFIREPDNQTAIEGEQVTLPCRVENKIGVIQWTRDGFGLGDTRDLSGYSRYKLIGSDDEKDWTLRISPVLLEDDAMFQCQVGAADGVAPIRSRSAQLTVYVPPEDPFIEQGDILEVTEDMDTTLHCVSPGGKPAADIYWHDGDGHVVVKDVRTSEDMLEDGKRFNTTSVITFKPKKKHHNKTFTCSASNIADRSRRSVSILMMVRYAPSVTLTSSARHGLLTEGDTVQFKCNAHANPHPTEYTWLVDGQRANGFESDYFIITNISQSYHNSIVKCEVRNEIGKSEETETIQVRYGPRVVEHPGTVAGDLGDSVTLHCQVDSNPAPTYTWTRGASRQAVGSSQNLTLIVSERTEGQYLCHSITEGYAMLTSGPASILLRRRPTITSPATQTGILGEIVHVVCEASSAPAPSGVIWTYMGRTIHTGNSKYEVLTTTEGFQFQSTLIIRDSNSEDFGYYGCAVTNSRGSAEASIYLEKQEEFSLLLVLIGIFATIIVILVITLMLLLCRNKISQLCSHKEDKPYKPNNINSITPPSMNNKTSLSDAEDEGWETERDSQRDLYGGNRVSTGYQSAEFPPKPDLISTEYSAAYGGYETLAGPGSLPQSDSQTSLHSASQLGGGPGPPGNIRHSTVLTVSDPRYSATYGNPYLRSPPKLSGQAGPVSYTAGYSAYSTFSPSDSPAFNPVSYIASPASTATVHSLVSATRSSVEPPPPPPPHYPSHLNGHGPPPGGSVMGIGLSNGSPGASHHRHPVSNDLYAVVTKPPSHQGPGVSVFRNSGMGEVPAMSGSPVPSFSSMKDTSPVTTCHYIMDNTGPGSHTGTHV